MNFDPDTTCLVVVDMQNDFCHPEGALYAETAEDAIPTINGLIDTVEDAGAKVAYTRDSHYADQFEDAEHYDEFDQWGHHCVYNSWGEEFHDDLKTGRFPLTVTKSTYDAFYDTSFESYLQSQHIADLLLCGTLANVCVLQTATSAALHDFRPVVVEDAVGYLDGDQRDAALAHVDFLCGDVVSSDDVTFTSQERVD